MKAKIFHDTGGQIDSFMIEGTIEEIQEKAELLTKQRKPDHCWSEIIEE